MKALVSVALGCCWLVLTSTLAHAGELKVDINRGTKSQPNYTAAGYTNWYNGVYTDTPATGTNTDTQIFPSMTGETVTIALAQSPVSASLGGLGLRTGIYQVGGDAGAKLVSDGITVDTKDLPAATLSNIVGEIKMSITGLQPGHHTLLSYHNHWDALAAGTLGPIDIYVNGALQVDNIQPSIRQTNTALVPVGYVEFDVANTTDITTILFAAETNAAPSVTIKNPIINGFEIDTPNSTRIASSPVPADGDEHADADAGSLTLRWSPALTGTAVSHDVYFGTNQTAVKNATHGSPEFKGNQAATNYLAAGLNSLLTCYWRIDEIDSMGNATKGATWMFRPRHLAFPGAEGYGRFARGGRGGVVIEVTNTNDSGAGSFRDAIEGNYGPRTVVFAVSGQIILNSDIIIDSSRPYITVAGQTAPGKGICFRRQQFALSGARDAVVRHVRMRVGKESGETQNGTGMSGVNHCIMDHCSISWGIDEELSTRTAKNVTFQRCHISEALNVAGHQNYPAGTAHGYAATVGGDVASLHHNLLSHCEGRNWSMGGGLDASGYYAGRLDIFNNVVYNWGGRTTDGGAHEVNFVNNYYKIGASSAKWTFLNPQYGGFPGTQQYYCVGNVMNGGNGSHNIATNNQSAGISISTENGGTLPQNSTPPYSALVSAPFFPSYATIDEVTNAYKKVLSDVGCTQPMVDDHDARVIRETIDGTYTFSGSVSGDPGLPDTTDDVGGWEDYGNAVRPADWDTDHDGLPNWWEQIKGFNPNSTPGDFSESNSDLDDDGYTALEDYLNWLAAPHVDCNAGSYVDINLAALTRGFTNNSPRYAVFTALNGTVVTNGNGRTARFTPGVSTNALAGFTFSVVDANGYNMTNTIGVRVVAGAVNSAPAFSTSSSDHTINVGVTLNLTNNATDADDGQILTYSLPVKPTNATIGSATGIINWRPLVTQAGTTNPFSVVVADNGSPSLSATQSFNVTVNPLTLPSVALPQIANGQIELTVSGQAGPDYALQGSSNLVDWTTLLITNPASMPFSWSTNPGALPAQYYRIKVGPPLP